MMIFFSFSLMVFSFELIHFFLVVFDFEIFIIIIIMLRMSRLLLVCIYGNKANIFRLLKLKLIYRFIDQSKLSIKKLNYLDCSDYFFEKNDGKKNIWIISKQKREKCLRKLNHFFHFSFSFSSKLIDEFFFYFFC